MNNELIKFLNENFYNVDVINRNSCIFCVQKDCTDINIDNEIYINRGFNNVNDLIKFIKNDIIK